MANTPLNDTLRLCETARKDDALGTPHSSNTSIEIVPSGWEADFARKNGYSFGIARDGMLSIAGQVSVDDEGRPHGVGDVEAQARRVFERVRAVVDAAGATMGDVVRTTTYITDREHRPVMNELRREYFSRPFPANTLLIVSGLALPEYLVEMDALALLPAR
jgi:2-iminobutanoate/2-iminopropanoate deaminase